MARKKALLDIPVQKEIFLKALEKSHGLIYTACMSSKVPRQNVYDWIKKDEDFAQSVKETREGFLDFTESKLYKNVKGGNVLAQMFVLKCLGKERGWVDKAEPEPPQKPFENITVNVVSNQPISPPDET